MGDIRTSFAVFSFFVFLLDMVSVCCLGVVTVSVVVVLMGEGRGCWLDWKAEGRKDEMEENIGIRREKREELQLMV
jgi:hypothetical protein